MRKVFAVWLLAGLPALADSVAATRAWVSNRVAEARAEWRADVASATNPAIAVVVLAATLAGSVMGDHCSPIADTTILSSTGAQCKHINHVMTQIPYASCTGLVCVVLYLVLGFLV